MFAANVVYNITQVSFRQRLCPERLLGRMKRTACGSWYGARCQSVRCSASRRSIGVRAALLVTAIGSSLAFLWIYFSPLRLLHEVPAEAERSLSEATSPRATNAAGPVSLTVRQASSRLSAARCITGQNAYAAPDGNQSSREDASGLIMTDGTAVCLGPTGLLAGLTP